MSENNLMSEVTLQKFVQDTLVSISLGVASASEQIEQAGAIPIALHAVGDQAVEQGQQLISFSVSVEVREQKLFAVDAGVAAKLFSIVSTEAGGKSQKEANKAGLHTVEFSVPMYFNSRARTKGEG